MKTKKQSLSTFLLLGLATNSTIADEMRATLPSNWLEPSRCMVAQSQNNRQQAVYFTQQTVEDGVQELVIVAPDEENVRVIKRITYQQRKDSACHYPAIAITRGGAWGWILAWSDTHKIHYTRMDADGLVFVPIKSLPIAQVINIEFLPNAALPTMHVQNQSGQTQLLHSEDDGRNWQTVE